MFIDIAFVRREMFVFLDLRGTVAIMDFAGAVTIPKIVLVPFADEGHGKENPFEIL